MSRINLLPWREERRKQRQQEFYAILGVAAGLGVLLYFATFTYMNRLQQSQQARNQMLRNEIALLDRDIKKIEQLEATRSKLLTRKAVIEELQKSRSQIVHLFDDLVLTLPDGVRLTSLKQQGGKLTLEGVAESNAKVSAYMRQLDASSYMQGPDLAISQFAADKASLRQDSYDFNLSVSVVQPKEGEGQGQGQDEGGEE